MRRASQTVEPLAERLGLPVIMLDDLRERRLSTEPVDDHGAAVVWCWANAAAALPGGESNLDAQRRGVAVIELMAQRHAGETIVVGTHGNLLALILQHWDATVNHAFWSRLSLPDIYALRVDDAGCFTIIRRRVPASNSCRRRNDVLTCRAHLLIALQPWRAKLGYYARSRTRRCRDPAAHSHAHALQAGHRLLSAPRRH
jgi:broad specificity phosphatase PhoE